MRWLAVVIAFTTAAYADEPSPAVKAAVAQPSPPAPAEPPPPAPKRFVPPPEPEPIPTITVGAGVGLGYLVRRGQNDLVQELARWHLDAGWHVLPEVVVSLSFDGDFAARKDIAPNLSGTRKKKQWSAAAVGEYHYRWVFGGGGFGILHEYSEDYLPELHKFTVFAPVVMFRVGAEFPRPQGARLFLQLVADYAYEILPTSWTDETLGTTVERPDEQGRVLTFLLVGRWR